jgi:hypothetical protein
MTHRKSGAQKGVAGWIGVVLNPWRHHVGKLRRYYCNSHDRLKMKTWHHYTTLHPRKPAESYLRMWAARLSSTNHSQKLLMSNG